MNGVPNITNIERERDHIICGIRGLHQVHEVMRVSRNVVGWKWLILMLMPTIPAIALAWVTPSIAINTRIGLTVLAMIVIMCLMAFLTMAFETMRLHNLGGNQLHSYSVWAHSNNLANAYVQTFTVPTALKGLPWTAVDRLVFAIEHDRIVYSLSFEPSSEVPMFSVPTGVLPDDQRMQRDLDVLFMHMANYKADLYDMNVQLRLQLPVEDVVNAANA